MTEKAPATTMVISTREKVMRAFLAASGAQG